MSVAFVLSPWFVCICHCLSAVVEHFSNSFDSVNPAMEGTITVTSGNQYVASALLHEDRTKALSSSLPSRVKV